MRLGGYEPYRTGYDAMKAIIGLGNPGARYAHNRHNAGFMVLDRLAAQWKARGWLVKHQARLSTVSLSGDQVVLAKPQTFMNNSGSAVEQILAVYGISPTNLLLVYDDLDLEVGQLRLRRKGSAGGHKGVRSAIAHLGTHDFHRLRIGIGSPPSEISVVDYVLGDFLQDESDVIQDVIDVAVQAAAIWVNEGIERAMAEFNGTFVDE